MSLRRRAAVLGAVLVLGIGLPPALSPASAAPASSAPASSAPASAPKVAPGVTRGADQVRLLSQTPYVQAGGSWKLQLALTAATPSTDRLRLEIYARLTTRSAFRQSLAGKFSDEQWRSNAMRLNSLPTDRGGGVSVSVPIDADSPDPDLPDFGVNRASSGLFPVRVELLDRHLKTVRSIVTYLLYSAGDQSKTGFPPLDVSLSLDIGASPPVPSSAPLTEAATPATIAADAGQLSSGTVSGIAGEVAALARHSGVPLSVGVTPQTADALAALAKELPSDPPGSRDRQAKSTLAGLSRLVAAGDELLPATYVTTSLSQLAAAGLDNEIERQFERGFSALGTDLHRTPATDTWMVDGPLDPASLQILEQHGAERLIVPSTALRALPKAVETLTVAAPARLADAGGNLLVDAADAQLDAHFSNSSDPVLAANQLLAELAMIQLEAPSRQRGVAIVPPPGWVASPAFLDTLLAGLSGNPLLKPVTAQQLFAAVPVAAGNPGERTLAPAPPPTPLSGASTIRLARGVSQAYGSVLPESKLTTAEMARRILISESSQYRPATRANVLGPVVAAATPLDQGLSLPGSTSITLTARKGKLPLTLLANPSLRARVQLRLSSDKLTFEPFTPAGGRCRRTTASAETCEMTLTSAVTTLKVPVEARTSGVFTLNVGLYSPQGGLVFGTNRDTVRSTAVSGVGVILIVLAALGLGYWWLRDIRHGRRARRLVDVGDDRDDSGQAGMGKLPGGDDPASADDPADVLSDFFSRPAPVYPNRTPVPAPDTNPAGLPPPVSPSRGGVGPTG